MRKFNVPPFILALIVLPSIFTFGAFPSFADDGPFIRPSNRGGSGLMEIPTARVLRENTYRLGIGQVSPYRYYYSSVSPLKGLEIDGRITEISDVPALTEGYGDYKDKAVDFKYRFLPEGKYMPAIALGLMDSHGSRIYPSQYIVASKQIYPFDFTLGFGNGRFGKSPLAGQTDGFELEIVTSPREWLNDSQFFWGIQFAPSEKYALMVEYSPIKYHEQTNDPAQGKYFSGPVSSKYNVGIRFKPTKWSEIDLSYQRGEKFGVNFSTTFDIGKPLLPIYEQVYQGKTADALDPIHERMIRALHNSGFSGIGVAIINEELWVKAQNDKYFYSTRAIGIVLELIAGINPENVKRIHVILTENEIPVVEFTTATIDLLDFYAEKMTFDEFLRMSDFKTAVRDIPDMETAFRKSFNYGWKPSLETFLNDPSGFFRYRLGASGWVSYYPWQGASFVTGLAAFPLNNITTTNEPLSIPVRTDIVEYKKENIVLERLMLNQTGQVYPGILAKVSGGILEAQYAGVDMEVAMPVLDGRILLGLSGSAVKKREPDNPVKLKTDDVKDVYTTAFINMRLNIPEQELALDVKAGRFLAGDNGVRFTVSKFINGVVLRTWYTYTDTSVFEDDFNRDYHDKGIAVIIPIRLFKGTDSRTTYSYFLSPWTRDTGQDIEHYRNLFDFIGRNTKIFLDKDDEMLY
ncbi:MAG: hypothetical protein C4560_08545 [Nitrospiraceae bacterium]|nr:MAG: hypothetical protein C4560_08545 [Nitrospiraceae bacterium]